MMHEWIELVIEALKGIEITIDDPGTGRKIVGFRPKLRENLKGQNRESTRKWGPKGQGHGTMRAY